MDSPITLDLFDFQAKASTWTHVGPHALEDPFFFKAVNIWTSEEAVFLSAHTDLDDDTDWRPIRPLGQGGYGMVGLWQKFDHNDTVIDSIAIKQQNYLRNQASQAKMTHGPHGLAKEAALMHQLNLLRKRNIIKLRGFKNNGPEKLWRFYFEFAPWGDLRVLKNNYRAWNTYFPEEFLWHIFHGLSEAALALRTGPFRDRINGEIYGAADAFVVHFDLKPENVFLGDPSNEEGPHFSNYPTVKMADFGLAKLTGPEDRENPRRYRGLGTPGYCPPEQDGHTVLWQRRPEGRAHMVAAQYNPDPERLCVEQEETDFFPGYQFESAHNTWCVGKIMYEMLTLAPRDSVNEAIAQVTEAQYWGPMREESMDEIETQREPEYSHDLRNLIRRCLRISPRRRPTPEQLHSAIENHFSRMSRGGLRNGRRVREVYRKIDIYHTPGPHSGISIKENSKDPELESLYDGRWDPRLRVANRRDIPFIPGGRKRRQAREAHLFMADKDDPARLIKRVRQASDFDDDDDGETEQPSGDSDDDDDDHGRARGKGGKKREKGMPIGGKEGEGDGKRAQGEGQGAQGETDGVQEQGGGIGGSIVSGRNTDDASDRSRRKDSVAFAKERREKDRKRQGGTPLMKGRGGRPSKASGLRRLDGGPPHNHQAAGDGAERDKQNNQGPQDGDDDNVAADRGRHDQHPGKDAFQQASESLRNRIRGRGLSTPSPPSRSPTRPGHSQKRLPGQPACPDYALPDRPPPSESPPGPPGPPDQTEGKERPTSSPPRSPAPPPPPPLPPRDADGGRRGGRARGRDGQRGGGGAGGQGTRQQRPAPCPRRADQAIIQQTLPTLEMQNVGGRPLRRRR